MDIDAFVVRNAPKWNRLNRLARQRRLTVTEADELLALHQATARDLSLVRSQLPDAEMVGRLSGMLSASRAALTAPRVARWAVVGEFFTAKLPAALYRARWWWGLTAVISLIVTVGLAVWLAHDPSARDQILPPDYVQQVTAPGGDFESYYRSAPARDFAFKVWTNNFFVCWESLFAGILLGLPVLPVLFVNCANIAVDGAFMFNAGRGDVFFSLILPHGMLELTSVFVAAGVGLKLGWTIIAPGARSRVTALQQEGRIAGVIAIGVMLTLACSGVIEAFVTPSGLPTAARIGIGAVAELGFLSYVFIVGRRAYRRGEMGDLSAIDQVAEVPAVA
ncbi:stage II sporulation protein M [Actinospica durhamensis]|uniref:Stage II sporulation protein M n=1 Tax=Actinospica durhamensis TaxID=1508375 RepID=A0A941EY83_9ACTN|nr:stage II sporulation protein M [Actinospica durhamensis]MBR7839588.1 stage II sporulation protein M [Actinospica durhamensis]